jgi:hypothetical protein
VIHVVPGPVNANVLLREARWAVESHKLAMTEAGGNALRQKVLFRRAHLERLQWDHGRVNRLPNTSNLAPEMFAQQEFWALGGDKQGQAHLLLAAYPLPKTEAVYRVIFERILGENVSTAPVDDGGS